MKLKLYRDKIISVVKGKDLVGVYVKLKEDELFNRSPKMELLLAEMSPVQADKIIDLWNNEFIDNGEKEKNKSIRIPVTDNDIEELRDGGSFDWSFPVEGSASSEWIDVELVNDNEEQL